ncbi:MAG TPA: ribosome maturation factor RimP [Verrucomicrobiae bacterium]|nr:ribosome maturation factor RimP [Verrucomicrobiae bacterium]
MEKQDIAGKIFPLAERIVASLRMELVDLEYKREGRSMVLRLFIDREGGVSLDDCADVSREVSAVLDVEDVIPGAFNLEVSSPGLNRPIRKPEDYARFTGRLVKIRTYELLEDEAGNRRKTFLGDLLGLERGVVRLKLREGQHASIPLEKIAAANLEFEW